MNKFSPGVSKCCFHLWTLVGIITWLYSVQLHRAFHHPHLTVSVSQPTVFFKSLCALYSSRWYYVSVAFKGCFPCLEISLHPAPIHRPVPGAAKQPQTITESDPCFTVRTLLFYLYSFCLCARWADVTWTKSSCFVSSVHKACGRTSAWSFTFVPQFCPCLSILTRAASHISFSCSVQYICCRRNQSWVSERDVWVLHGVVYLV